MTHLRRGGDVLAQLVLRGQLGSCQSSGLLGVSSSGLLELASTVASSSTSSTSTSHSSCSSRVAASQRGITTSASASAELGRGFQSVLRKPVPKALIYNRDSFEAWKGTGFDAHKATELLQESYAERLRKQQQSETLHLHHRLSDVLHKCRTLQEVQLVVDEMHGALGPDNLALAASLATKLPQAPEAHPASSYAIMDAVMPLLLPHCSALRNGSLARLLSALARSGYRPSGDMIAALKGQLEGDAGQERVDAAGPRETAALMVAAARLRWGSAEVWERLGEAALAQLQEMSPDEVESALYGAATAPPAAAATACGPSSLLWVHAEQVILNKIHDYDMSLLARTLLSFSASGAPAGVGLWEKMAERLSGKGAGKPGPRTAISPDALLTTLRAAAQLKQRVRTAAQAAGMGGSGGDLPTVDPVLAEGFKAAALVLTHYSTRDLAKLLGAVEAAYGAKVDDEADEGSAAARTKLDVPAERAISDLLNMASDVLAIRGLRTETAGAIPAPVSTTSVHGRHTGAGDAAARAFLQLVRLGFLSGKRLTQLLARLADDAEKMAGGMPVGGYPAAVVARPALSPAAAAMLVRGFALVAVNSDSAGVKQAVQSEAARLAPAVAQALALGAAALPLPVAAAALPALVSIAPSASAASESHSAALVALADQLVASDLSTLSSPQLRQLRRVVADAPALEGHALHKSL